MYLSLLVMTSSLYLLDRKLITALSRVERQDLVDRVIVLLTGVTHSQQDPPQTNNQSTPSASAPHSQPSSNDTSTTRYQQVQHNVVTLDQPTPIPPAIARDQLTPVLPAIQSYTVYLKQRYRGQVPTFSTQWPPPSTKKVFNLAMIRKERVERGALADDEFVRLTIHGCVDDILELKTPVKLEDIFSRDEASRRVILIEGAPGSGKTTLAWYICQKWESGELFQEFNLVVLVQLRDPDIQSAQSIADLLPCSSMSRLQSVCSEIEASEGRGVLWVLDGWDELPPPLQQSSLFHQLISPTRVSPFTQSAVLVTSRPISSADLHPLISSRVEVIGFTEAQIKEYFTESLKHDDQAVQKLEHHLSQNPFVESSCYLPLNAAIIVHLFLALGCTLPTNLHMTFCLIIANCVFRYLKDRANRGSEIPPLSSLDHSSDIRVLFPPDIQTHFKNICKLAYIGICENKLTFFASDFHRCGLSAPLCSLGLLREVESFVTVGRSVSYNFLHLSVQELLAAFHISDMSPKDQVETFQSLMSHPRFFSVLQFYAGITKLQTPGMQNVIAGVISSAVREIGTSHEVTNKTRLPLVSMIRCLHETYNVQLCLSVMECLLWELDLRFTTLTPTDCLSIGYFSSCVCYATDSQDELVVRFSWLDDIGVKYLMRGIIMYADRTIVESGNTCRLDINLTSNDIHSSGAHSIAEALKSCSLISKLCMRNDSIGEEGLRHIAEALVSNSSLVELYLSSCSIQITDHSGPAVTEMLQKNKSLQTLDLQFNDPLSDCGALYIAEGLRHNAVLSKLDLDGCGITTMGAKALAQALTVNTSLHSLNLSYYNDKRAMFSIGRINTMSLISDMGAEGLAKMLVVNVSLERLELGGHVIHHKGAGLLADALKMNRSLKVLKLYDNYIQDKGAQLLADALKVNRSLQHLDVARNGISDTGAEELAEMLVVNNTLKCLHLGSNDIKGPGLQKLGTCLKTNKTLLALCLSYGDLSPAFIANLKKFMLSLADNCCLNEINITDRYHYILRKEVEVVNTTRLQRGHPVLELTKASLYYQP